MAKKWTSQFLHWTPCVNEWIIYIQLKIINACRATTCRIGISHVRRSWRHKIIQSGQDSRWYRELSRFSRMRARNSSCFGECRVACRWKRHRTIWLTARTGCGERFIGSFPNSIHNLKDWRVQQRNKKYYNIT